MVLAEDGSSLGYGYVQYQHVTAADLAIKRANRMLLKGQQIGVAYFKGRKDRGNPQTPKFTNLYIKCMPQSIKTEGDLVNVFKDFGEITSCYLPKVSDGFWREMDRRIPGWIEFGNLHQDSYLGSHLESEVSREQLKFQFVDECGGTATDTMHNAAWDLWRLDY